MIGHIRVFFGYGKLILAVKTALRAFWPAHCQLAISKSRSTYTFLKIKQNSKYDKSYKGILGLENQFLGSKQLSEHSDQHLTSWLYQKVCQLAHVLKTIRIQHMIDQTWGLWSGESVLGSKQPLRALRPAHYQLAVPKKVNLHIP